MIISSAPLRVSFCGGGTDFKQFYRTHSGSILGTAIDKRVYVFINELSEYSDEKIRFTYRITESVNDISELQHPVVKAALSFLRIEKRINIATMADIPGNSGLGSSSSFTVALISGLFRFKGMNVSNQTIVETAYKIEREILEESGGIQDYLHGTYGSFRFYELHRDEQISQTELFSQELDALLSERTVLIKVGKSRFSNTLSSSFQASINGFSRQQELLRNKEHALKAKEIIEFGESAEEKYRAIAIAVNANWIEKKKIGGVASREVVELEEKLGAKKLMAFKLCGAGNSGYAFCMFTGTVPESVLRDHQTVRIKIERKGLETLVL